MGTVYQELYGRIITIYESISALYPLSEHDANINHCCPYMVKVHGYCRIFLIYDLGLV